MWQERTFPDELRELKKKVPNEKLGEGERGEKRRKWEKSRAVFSDCLFLLPIS